MSKSLKCSIAFGVRRAYVAAVWTIVALAVVSIFICAILACVGGFSDAGRAHPEVLAAVTVLAICGLLCLGVIAWEWADETVKRCKGARDE